MITLDKQASPKPVSALPLNAAPEVRARGLDNTFGKPREFLGNRFVYALISQRARGLSIGINLNPDHFCNFDCAYCEVNRDKTPLDRAVDLDVMAAELEGLLARAFQGRLRELPYFRLVPEELLKLKAVTLSGDGEPTLCANFAEVVREVVHIRSLRRFPFFKIVLITNTSGLGRPDVDAGLIHLTSDDEIWVKLDAGTQEYMDRVNRSKDITLQQVLEKILLLGRERAVVIQSLFPLMHGLEPPAEEIEAYVQRLKALESDGAKISLVQIYSAHRAPHRPDCGHLPLKALSRIAQRVREVTGLKAEVF